MRVETTNMMQVSNQDCTLLIPSDVGVCSITSIKMLIKTSRVVRSNPIRPG